MGCCVIFCAAEFDAPARPLEKDDYILAADGGLKHTRKLGIEPNEIIGDFDSLGFTPPGAWTAPGLTTPWPISRRCNFSPTGAPWAIS